MRIQQIVFASRGEVEVREASLEAKLTSTQILIETACSMVSQGTELAALTGTHSKSGLKEPPAWLRYPSVPGYLVCGTVVDRGAEVRAFAVGDRVVGEGAGVWNSHVSHLVMEAGDWKVVPIRPEVCFEEAVATKMGSIAMTGVRVLHPELGDSVAVLGLGMVGQLAARLAVLAGAGRVAAVDPLEKRRAAAASFRGIIALAAEDPALAPVPAGDRQSGFDHVIEASGAPRGFLLACEIARLCGKVAVLSSPHKTMELRLYDQIHSRGLQILGAHGAVLASQAEPRDRWTDARQRRLFMDLLAERRLEVRPLISHRVAFSRAAEIYRGLRENPGAYLGVIFTWKGV